MVPTILSTHEAFLRGACESLGYEDVVFELLRTASREIRLELPLRKDDGSVVVYNGYRVQHHNSRGPYKGGLRYHPEIDMAEIRGLACLMSLKTALVGLPLGGAKGGIDCDPGSLTDRELERLTRKFVSKSHRNIGPNLDIPAPDVGTNAQVMAWIQDQYSTIYGYSPAVVTGKPIATGGCEGRESATGEGVALVLDSYARATGEALAGKSVAIQGFGNVGQYAARALHERRMKLVAVSDSKGGVVNGDGIDFDHLMSQKLRTGSVVGTHGTEAASHDDVLTAECDVLIPAALGCVIHKDNAGEIRSKLVVEAANGPVTERGHELLTSRDVIILPDILVNAGGVIVSYFEWVQNLQQLSWSVEQVRSRLSTRLKSAANDVWERAEARGCSYRAAAYEIGTERLKDAFFVAGF